MIRLPLLWYVLYSMPHLGTFYYNIFLFGNNMCIASSMWRIQKSHKPYKQGGGIYLIGIFSMDWTKGGVKEYSSVIILYLNFPCFVNVLLFRHT